MYRERKRLYNSPGYEDNDTKLMGIQFMDEVFGLKMMINPVDKKIDLVSVDGTFGLDVEQPREQGDDSGCYINYWNKDNYSRNMKSGMGFPTVNMPWWRKYQYYTPVNDSFLFDPNWERNCFLRFTTDFLCAIFVPAEVIQNRKKALDASFKTRYITTGDVEIFKVFRREDVLTYVRKDLNSPWVLFKPTDIPEEPVKLTEEEKRERIKQLREIQKNSHK